MKLIKTPPPTLLRARFATVLDHLPSVPSVVLPIMSLVDTDQAHLLLKPINKRREITDSFGHSIWRDRSRADQRLESIWQNPPVAKTFPDKFRHFVPDKICAGRL